MCLLTQKNVFATSCAMQCFIYLCASNFEKPINVINGLEGSRIEDFYRLKTETMNLTSRDLFLDNVTGDFYLYSESSGQWLPIANAGLHSNRAVQVFNSIGKYMIKAPIYKPQPRLDKYGLFLQRNYENFCFLKKIHIQHWLLQDVEIEFVVATRNTWDIHPFNFVNPKRTFLTLGEGPRGPMIIEIGCNIIATQFTIEEEYPETMKIFSNFIKAKLKDITNLKEDSRLLIEKLAESSKNNYVDPLVAAKNENQANRQIRMLGTSRPQSGISNQTHQSVSYVKIRPTSAKHFSHVGYSSKKIETLDIIDNNAILVNNVIEANNKAQNPNRSLSLIGQKIDTKSCDNFLKSEPNESYAVLNVKKIESKVKSRPQTASLARFDDLFEKSPSNQKEKNNKISLDNFESKSKKEIVKNITAYEMRKMLHPDINPQYLPDNQELWV